MTGTNVAGSLTVARGCDHAPMRRSLLIVLAAVLVLPATASAKLTRLPGTGETPTVEVDAAGTALVAWYVASSPSLVGTLVRTPSWRSA